MRLFLGTTATVLTLALLADPARAADPAGRTPQRGSVRFEPVGDANGVPPGYRLSPATFSYELTPKRKLPSTGVEIFDLRFPSPVKSAYECNDTVAAEFYRPVGDGPFPAVIVLDILAGDQSLSRGIALLLAQNRISALFVQMAYYGPRRPADAKVRLLSPNVARSVEGVRQSVLDCRYAAAWLASRPDIDPKQVGILGTSLGSFIAGITAEMDQRLGKVALLVSGGGFVDAYYDDPRGAKYIRMYEKLGGSRTKIKEFLAPADPLTHAANLKGRDVLMVLATRDQVVPPKAGEALWEAAGRPKVLRVDATHEGAGLYALPILEAVLNHFAPK